MDVENNPISSNGAFCGFPQFRFAGLGYFLWLAVSPSFFFFTEYGGQYKSRCKYPPISSQTSYIAPPLPTKVPPSAVEVPFLPLTPVFAVSWAYASFPEQQATPQTSAVGSELPESATNRRDSSSV
jgi:hypothetical protein